MAIPHSLTSPEALVFNHGSVRIQLLAQAGTKCPWGGASFCKESGFFYVQFKGVCFLSFLFWLRVKSITHCRDGFRFSLVLTKWYWGWKRLTHSWFEGSTPTLAYISLKRPSANGNAEVSRYKYWKKNMCRLGWLVSKMKKHILNDHHQKKLTIYWHWWFMS